MNGDSNAFFIMFVFKHVGIESTESAFQGPRSRSSGSDAGRRSRRIISDSNRCRRTRDCPSHQTPPTIHNGSRVNKTCSAQASREEKCPPLNKPSFASVALCPSRSTQNHVTGEAYGRTTESYPCTELTCPKSKMTSFLTSSLGSLNTSTRACKPAGHSKMHASKASAEDLCSACSTCG